MSYTALISVPNNKGESPVNERGSHSHPPFLHRASSVPATPLPSSQAPDSDLKPPTSQSSKDPWVSNGTVLYQEQCLPVEAPHADQNTDGEPSSAVPSTQHTLVPSPPKVQALRALFSPPSSNTPIRRTKSERHVRVAPGAGQCQSTVPEVCTDATLNDRLWSKLEPGSHRDSVSSSSSISSSDTVIDLSLPNLARKSLTCLSSAVGGPSGSGTGSPWANHPHSVVASYATPRVSKSKSNPNLRQGELEDELQSRPLGTPREAPTESPSRLTQRRHTWSRLYMEGLKQSSSASAPAKRPSAPAAAPSSSLDTGTSMSKSLGDLTSDDIACNFDSKYRSISRSFIVRPSRDQLRKGSPLKPRPPGDLTEQLRMLTDVEPLTARDFSPLPQEEEEEEAPLRRMSSRSQSRVRYIANRAKQAQERLRLQRLSQTTAGAGSGSGSPIEERGNPEGACCVARSPCAGLDLLSQLTPPGAPNRQSQTDPDPNPDLNEVFFRLKL